MPATLLWYEGDNTVDGDGNYPGDEAAVSDVERMVGDLVSGRKFRDTDTSNNRAGTTPSRSEVLETLRRAEASLDTRLRGAGYSPVAASTATSYPGPFRDLLEARAQLTSLRLLAMRPVQVRDAIAEEEDDRSRSNGFAATLRSLYTRIDAGTYPLPRTGTTDVFSVGAPETRDPIFTFELQV